MAISILAALTKANAQFANLRETLIKGREILVAQRNHFPDLADALDPQIADFDAKIAALAEPLSPDALASLVTFVVPELVNIARGKIEPKEHAGDSI